MLLIQEHFQILTFLYLNLFDSDLITTALPTTAAASTLPATTFRVTTATPSTVPAMPPITDCEDGEQGCGGETEASYDYGTAMGKTITLTFLVEVSAEANSLTSSLVSRPLASHH